MFEDAPKFLGDTATRILCYQPHDGNATFRRIAASGRGLDQRHEVGVAIHDKVLGGDRWHPRPDVRSPLGQPKNPERTGAERGPTQRRRVVSALVLLSVGVAVTALHLLSRSSGRRVAFGAERIT
jgi:hypothetical protein